MVRSTEPVANHSLDGSKASERTQPRCPDITALSSQFACHCGVGTFGRSRTVSTLEVTPFVLYMGGMMR
jgi:hypothetical protein